MIVNALLLLGSYKDQIGLIIQLGLLVATFVLIRVGLMQATAAIAQGKAADAQAVAAIAQSATAQNQLDLAVRQMYANLSSSNAETRPILKIIWPQGLDFGAKEISFVITNCGLGPALDLEAFYGKDQSEAAGLHGEFLGVNDVKKEHFDLKRIAHEQLNIHYSSTQGARYETTVTFHTDVGFMQFHRLVKKPFDGILDGNTQKIAMV